MREMIEKVSYAPRIELFARERFDGWNAWGERGVNMDSLIDVISIVIFFGLIMYAAIKLDEAARRLNDVEERIYRERKLK